MTPVATHSPIRLHPIQCVAASKRCSSVEAAMNYLFSGGADQKVEERMFECNLCMADDIPESDIKTLDCDHRFCR